MIQHQPIPITIKANPPTLNTSPTHFFATFYRLTKPNWDIVYWYAAALERTFLAYLRTSLALSSIGVAVAQLFRLQHTPTPNPIFGFFVLGKPMACICQGAAIYCLFLGAYRSWRLQNAIVRGKAISGGFEFVMLGLGVAMVIFRLIELSWAYSFDRL